MASPSNTSTGNRLETYLPIHQKHIKQVLTPKQGSQQSVGLHLLPPSVSRKDLSRHRVGGTQGTSPQGSLTCEKQPLTQLTPTLTRAPPKYQLLFVKTEHIPKTGM